jgi:hypothetical protein
VTRGSALTGPAHPRFRCRVCKEFVHGTESGHCPRCGLASATAQVLPPDRTARPLLALLVLIALALVGVWFGTRR